MDSIVEQTFTNFASGPFRDNSELILVEVNQLFKFFVLFKLSRPMDTHLQCVTAFPSNIKFRNNDENNSNVTQL